MRERYSRRGYREGQPPHTHDSTRRATPRFRLRARENARAPQISQHAHAQVRYRFPTQKPRCKTENKAYSTVHTHNTTKTFLNIPDSLKLQYTTNSYDCGIVSGEMPSAVIRKAGEERVSAGRSGAIRERPPPAAEEGSSQFFFHSWKWKSACCRQPGSGLRLVVRLRFRLSGSGWGWG